MFYSFKENLGASKHVYRRVCRRVLAWPATKYFDRLKDRHSLSLVLDDDNRPFCCKFCGYVHVRIHFRGGWEMEVCSAANLERLLANKEKLDSWAATLPGKVTADTV